MDGWMDGWMDGKMDGWKHVQFTPQALSLCGVLTWYASSDSFLRRVTARMSEAGMAFCCVWVWVVDV